MSTFETISENVLKWADDKNLLQEKNKLAQYMKFQEEAGELARGILRMTGLKSLTRSAMY